MLFRSNLSKKNVLGRLENQEILKENNTENRNAFYLTNSKITSCHRSSAKDPDPDPLDPQDFISWIRIRIRKNMRIHGSGSNGQNINQKLQQKKILFSKPKSELLKKRDYKKFPDF